MANTPAVPGSNFLAELPEEVRNALALVGVTEVTEVHDVEELTGGWQKLNKDAKARLVGVPFTIVRMAFNDSDYGKVDGSATRQFVVLHVLTDDMKGRFVLVDGGTGIYESALAWCEINGDPKGKAIRCTRGLRASSYTYTDETTGEESPATTYYFD